MFSLGSERLRSRPRHVALDKPQQPLEPLFSSLLALRHSTEHALRAAALALEQQRALDHPGGLLPYRLEQRAHRVAQDGREGREDVGQGDGDCAVQGREELREGGEGVALRDC